MKNKWFILVAFLFLFLQACGEATQGFNSPTLSFVGSNIDHYQNGVPHRIPQIEIQVKENLNPASVNSLTVHLMPGDSSMHGQTQMDPSGSSGDMATPFDGSENSTATDVVVGDVRYDSATRTIIFKPLTPLAQGTTYHIRAHNLELADGRKVDVIPRSDGIDSGVIQFSFMTTHLHPVLQTRYDRQGSESTYAAFRIENNKLKERKQYKANKELRFSMLYDEPLSNRIATSLYKDPQGNITSYNYDVISSDGITRSLQVGDPGEDNTWGTNDDLVKSWAEREPPHLTHEIVRNYALINKSDPVPWQGEGTAGFTLSSIYLTEHGGTNFEHRTVFYRDLGLDGKIDMDPVTQELIVIDDNISLWYKRDYLNGKRMREWSIGGVGVGEGGNGKLFTDDDIATGLTVYEYYPNDSTPLAGELKQKVTFYSADFSNPIRDWLLDVQTNTVRADAPIHGYNLYTYDPEGNLLEDAQYSPGPDELKGTADDYIIQRTSYSDSPNVTGGTGLGLN